MLTRHFWQGPLWPLLICLFLAMLNGQFRAQETDVENIIGDFPDCEMISGPSQNLTCIFPFTFDNVTYDGCITVADPDNKPWCSTKVTDLGFHVSGLGHWGYCNVTTCPISVKGTLPQADAVATPTLLSPTADDDEEEVFPECLTTEGEKGTCLPPSLCNLLTFDIVSEDECELVAGESDTNLGVCCVEREIEVNEVSFSEEDKPKEEDEEISEEELKAFLKELELVLLLIEQTFGNVTEEEPARITGPAPVQSPPVLLTPEEHDTEEGGSRSDIATVPPTASAPTQEGENTTTTPTTTTTTEGGENTTSGTTITTTRPSPRPTVTTTRPTPKRTQRPVTVPTPPPEDKKVATADSEGLHLIFNRPTEEAMKGGQVAQELEKVASDFQFSSQLSDEEAEKTLSKIDSEQEMIRKICPWVPAPKCDSTYKYRSFDGSCNNLIETNYGRAATALQRMAKSSYTGNRALPRRAQDGKELPNARVLSSELARTPDVPDNLHTILVMQMGQFIDHDLAHSPTFPNKCCDKADERHYPETYNEDECYPILIPKNDSFFQGSKTCMNLARSMTTPGLKCNLAENHEQVNQLTHWLDGSNIYGSSDSQAKFLRLGVQGQLKVTRMSGSRHGALPACSAEQLLNEIVDKETHEMCELCPHCFFAGDGRVNEQPNLIVIHTIWMREHNRIARNLEKLNPEWDDETLFQEARRITIAEYQHIIFKEWLPIVLGNSFLTRFNLWPRTKGHSMTYNDTIDPRISNEFASAGFRFGHSLIPSSFHMTSEEELEKGLTPNHTLSLRSNFFQPFQFRSNVGIFDDLIRGMMTQEGGLWDDAFTRDLTEHLFETKPGHDGLDLVALNIQRGRDHGVRGYNIYREVCNIGSGRVTNFSELNDTISPKDVEKLERMYDHVDDIDLFVGGFLEHQEDDSILGSVFRCIVGEQFARLKLGDRFFYDLGISDATSFTEDQLREIRKTSMARILCDNANFVSMMQPQAFKMAGSSRVNQLQSCSSFKTIPAVSVAPFRAAKKRAVR